MTRMEAERRRRGWNQTALAYHSRLSQAEISRIERGRAIPTRTIAERLGLALGVRPEELLSPVSGDR
jgi:transcriptional regulator with XRE-family HTH domain